MTFKTSSTRLAPDTSLDPDKNELTLKMAERPDWPLFPAVSSAFSAISFLTSRRSRAAGTPAFWQRPSINRPENEWRDHVEVVVANMAGRGRVP